MTVLAPTPDGPSRGVFLRRACFLAVALALTVAFGLSLSGIASTQGTLRPDGRAAAIAAQRQRTTEAGAGRHHCRRGDRARGVGSARRV